MEKKLQILALIIITVLISYPVLFMDVAKGHDLDFHLMRIEGILSDASWRNIPVRMQSGWIDGYGYPVSILYGDLFLYVGAVFRKLGLPIMPAYRLFAVCINAATVFISYRSFKVFHKGWTPVISTALYTTAAYRLVDAYVRSAIGETLAITFFPAVAALIYLILTYPEKTKRRRYIVLLGLAFSAVICSHTLTTSMMLVVMAFTVPAGLIVACKGKERLYRFLEIIEAGIISILVTLFFTVPFMDFYLTAGIGFAMDKEMKIQGEGLHLSDFFAFFSNPFSTEGGDIQKTPGIALMTVFAFAVIYLIICIVKRTYFSNHRRIVFMTVVSLILFVMASHVFPWDFIEDHFPLGGILTAIEFPMRYLAFALVFLSILAGDLFDGFMSKLEEVRSAQTGLVRTCIVSAACLMCVFNVANLCVYNHFWEKKARFMKTEDLGRWDYYAMDFQLENTTVDDVPLGCVYENMLSMEILSRSSNDFLIACVTGPEYGWIQLPVFAYKYYQACDLEDPSKIFEIHEGANRTVGVLLPGDYSGVLHVYWKEPLFWRITEVISFLSFLGCVLVVFFGEKWALSKGSKTK